MIYLLLGKHFNNKKHCALSEKRLHANNQKVARSNRRTAREPVSESWASTAQLTCQKNKFEIFFSPNSINNTASVFHYRLLVRLQELLLLSIGGALFSVSKYAWKYLTHRKTALLKNFKKTTEIKINKKNPWLVNSAFHKYHSAFLHWEREDKS